MYSLSQDYNAPYWEPVSSLRPGDVIEAEVTDYSKADSLFQPKVRAVIKVTSISQRGSLFRLFGERLTTSNKGREWSSKWLSGSATYYIPF